MRAIKCDRCGAFETVADDPRIPKNGEVSFMHFNDNTKSWDAHDLCRSCLSQLETWWKDKAIRIPDETILCNDGKFYTDVTEQEIKKHRTDMILLDDLVSKMSSRSHNILKRIGYKTLGDVRKHLTLSFLRKCRNCGPKAEEEIINVLKEYDIEIPEGEEPKPIDFLPSEIQKKLDCQD